MLLSRVLWAQDVWHWSALTTGFSIVPGPIMVPLFAFLLAGRLIDRFGPGLVIAAGSTSFAAGMAWMALAVGLRPDYVGDVLGGLHPDRDRRRPDPADADGDRDGVAARPRRSRPARRWSTCCARSDSRSGSPC